MPKPVSFTVHAQLASKSNSRQLVINPTTGKWRSIKSTSARLFEQAFRAQCPARARVEIGGYVVLTVTVYYRSKRSDLDVSMVMDCLERERVIKNDRQVVELHARKRWDKADPRVEVKVEEVEL